MSGIRWTDEEIRKLVKMNSDDVSLQKAADTLGRSYPSVSGASVRLGLHWRRRSPNDGESEFEKRQRVLGYKQKYRDRNKDRENEKARVRGSDESVRTKRSEYGQEYRNLNPIAVSEKNRRHKNRLKEKSEAVGIPRRAWCSGDDMDLERMMKDGLLTSFQMAQRLNRTVGSTEYRMRQIRSGCDKAKVIWWSADDTAKLHEMASLGKSPAEMSAFFPERTHSSVVEKCNREKIKFRHRWTDEENSMLLHDGLSNGELAELFGVSKGAIKTQKSKVRRESSAAPKVGVQ